MLATVASVFVVLVLQLLLPHKAKPVADYDKLILVNAYKYNIYEIFALIPLFSFMGLICYFFYLLGNDIQKLLFANRVADFALYPPETFWMLPGICFGFGLILTPMDLLYHLLLREEYPAYIEYTNRKHGYDGFKVIRPMCVLFTAAGLFFSVLGLDWYTEIKGDKIVIDEYFAVTSKEYSVEQVRAITHYEKGLTPEGIEKVDPHYEITFSDGYVWDTSNNLAEVKHEQYMTIAKYLARKADVQIIFEEIDIN